MSGPHGIIVFGANGSGKMTFGRELARILGFKHMDHEDYVLKNRKFHTLPRAQRMNVLI